MKRARREPSYLSKTAIADASARDQLVYQVGGRGCAVFAHQPGAVDLDGAVADLQRLADLLGCQALQQAGRDFALASGQVGLDGTALAQVFQGPDAGRVRLGAVERAARDMAPEHLAIGALHDAVVGIEALGVQDGLHVGAQALVLFGAWVQYAERLPDQHLARGTEHAAQMVVAIDHVAVAGHHHPDWGHFKCETIVNGHGGSIYEKLPN